MDQAEILADAQRQAERLGPAGAEDFWRIDGANARMMRAGYL